jgi:hypothetical protein
MVQGINENLTAEQVEALRAGLVESVQREPSELLRTGKLVAVR